jgi:hypothetical protein
MLTSCLRGLAARRPRPRERGGGQWPAPRDYGQNRATCAHRSAGTATPSWVDGPALQRGVAA